MTLRILTLAATFLLPFAAHCAADETAADAAAPVEAAAQAEDASTQVETASTQVETELVQEILPPPPPGQALAPSGARRLQILVQLVDVSAAQADLGGIRIRAIAPDGSFDEAFSDRQGRATVGVQTRPTVLTATGRDLHATMMVYPQRIDSGREPRPVQIPLLHASQGTLMRTIEGLGAAGGGASWEPTEGQSVPALRYRIPLSADGSLRGRLVSLFRPSTGRRDLSGMNVFILQRGQIVRTAVSDAEGRFTVPDLAPGFYGVIASGSAGYGAFGFEAVRPAGAPAPPESASLAPAPETLVSLRQPEPAGELEVVLAPPQLVPAIADSIVADYPPGPFDGLGEFGPPGFPMGPFGGPGQGFGGGGGGSNGGLFGGGLGGLILPAAIGAGIWAAIDDDDEDDFVPPPASPVTP